MKRVEISRVAPSVGYLLRQKNINDPAASELEHLFSDSVWENKETILTCLIGVHCEKSSHHTLLLPDTLGIEDDDGKLNNHVSLSLAVKYDGQECDGKNLSRFLNRIGVTNKTIFCAKDLKPLFSSRSEVFIDFSEIITAAFVASVISESCSMVVRNNAQKQVLQKSLKKTEEKNDASF
ncbi:unnamed protein product [Caenorhabditis nigoni]